MNFCDDLRGGGLGGNGESRFFFFFSEVFPSGVFPSALAVDEPTDDEGFLFNFSVPLPSPLTVEFDDEEVSDSRRAGRPLGSTTAGSVSFALLPDRPLKVTGGLFTAGLPCRTLDGVLRGAMMPGDMDDMDVGVVSLL